MSELTWAKHGWINTVGKRTPIMLMSNDSLPVCPQCKATMRETVHYLTVAVLQHCRDNAELDTHPHKFEVGELLYTYWCPTDKCLRARAQRLREGVTPIITEAIERKPETILSKFGIPEKYYHYTLDSILKLDKLVKEFKKYAATKDKKSLFMTGNSGAGKTHIAVGILIELITQGKKNMWFQDIPELLLKLRESHRPEKENDFTEYEIIHTMQNYDFLVLDDLGAEKSTDYSIQALQIIINGRLNDMKPTIITSNLVLTTINETMPRIASRLAEYETKSFINIPDYRKKRE